MKYLVQWSTVCSCDTTAFLSTSRVGFVFIWAVNSFQRSDYPYREILWFPFSYYGIYLCSAFAVFYLLQLHSLSPMKVTSPSLPCLRIYSTPPEFSKSVGKGCYLSTYYMLFYFETVIRNTTHLKILNSSSWSHFFFS